MKITLNHLNVLVQPGEHSLFAAVTQSDPKVRAWHRACIGNNKDLYIVNMIRLVLSLQANIMNRDVRANLPKAKQIKKIFLF